MAELVASTTTELKFSELGENVTGSDPVPLRFTACGLVSAESVNVSTPVAHPSAVGVKVTPTVHVPPAAILVPQLFDEIANGPLVATPPRLSAAFSRLVKVTVFAALVSFTAMLPKLRLVGDKLTGLLPLPERLTVCVPALSVMVTVPAAEPSAAGVNVTSIVHHSPGASAAVQVSVWLNGPVRAMPETCRGPVPLLCTVMLRAALEVPNTEEEKDKLVGVTVAAGVVPVPLSGMV